MSKYDELVDDLQATALKLQGEPYPNCILVERYADRFLKIYEGLKKYSTGRNE